jgi:hypothetical protein
MPNHDTFSIKPIGEFVKKYLTGISVDPFARNKDWFTYTNDLNPKTSAQYHMDAEEFLKMLKEKNVIADIVILDPVYSARQLMECYNNIDRKVTQQDTQLSAYIKKIRNIVDDIVPIGGKVLSFGWNSVGMGIKRNYELEEILLICHGGGHNDTICICEKKLDRINSPQYNMFEENQSSFDFKGLEL